MPLIQAQAVDPLETTTMSRQATLNTLKEYFAGKGKFLTIEEYKEANDTPFRFQIVKRVFGSWGRLKGLVGEVTPLVKAEAPKTAPKAAPKTKTATKVVDEGATEDNG